MRRSAYKADVTEGWTAEEITAMTLYAGKSSGVSNSTMDKFFQILALVINGERHPLDPKKFAKFPRSVQSAKSLLKIKREGFHKIVPICPSKRVRRRKGKEETINEVCGYALNEKSEFQPPVFACEMCDIEWEKDVVEGFCQDVMHQIDEGVTRWLLSRLVDGCEEINLSKAEFNAMDLLWLAIRVPGHENRKTRSLKYYKRFKAHELRSFLQHGVPFITRGILPDKPRKIYCLASSIAWTATKDSVSQDDVKKEHQLCDEFLK